MIRVVEAVGGEHAPEALRLLRAEKEALEKSGVAQAKSGTRDASGQFISNTSKPDNVSLGSPGPLFDSVKPTKASKPPRSANVKTSGEVGGNSPDYALRRLKRDNAELAAKVVAGEISAHKAAVVAGFRRRLIQVDADSADQIVKQIRKNIARANLALFAFDNFAEQLAYFSFCGF